MLHPKLVRMYLGLSLRDFSRNHSLDQRRIEVGISPTPKKIRTADTSDVHRPPSLGDRSMIGPFNRSRARCAGGTSPSEGQSMTFRDLSGRAAAVVIEPLDPYRHLPAIDRALMGMVEGLGYTMPQAAEILKMDRSVAHKRYWKARDKMRPSHLLRDEFLERSPDLKPRDLCAMELVEVLGFSLGSAAELLNINKGHLSRRIAMAKGILEQTADAGLLD